MAEMREAIEFHLEGLAADGDPIPEPTGPGVYIEQHAAAAVYTYAWAGLKMGSWTAPVGYW